MAQSNQHTVAEQAIEIMAGTIRRVAEAAQGFTRTGTWQSTMASLASLGRALDIYRILPPGSDIRDSSILSSVKDLTPDEIAEVLLAAFGATFAGSNLESSSDGVATYRVALTAEGAKTDAAQSLVAFIDDLNARLTIRAATETSAQVGLSVGAAAGEPATLSFGPDRIDLDVDLAAARGALTTISKAFDRRRSASVQPAGGGSELEIEELGGRLRASIVAVSELGLKLESSIAQEVRLSARTSEGRFAFRLAPSDPLMSVWFDGQEGALGLSLGIGAFEARLPYTTLVDAADASGEVDLSIPGLTFELSFSDQDQHLTVGNLSFGDATATLKRGETALVTVDLNAKQRRSLDLHIRPQPGSDRVMLGVTPGLNLVVTLSLESIRDDLAENFPDFLAGDSYTLTLAGGGVLATIPPGKSFPGGFKVNKGKLTLKSASATRPVTVPEGRCLVSRPPDSPRDDESHPLLRLLDVIKPKTRAPLT